MKKLLAVCAALAAIATFSSFMLTTAEKTETQLSAFQTQRVCFTVVDELGDPIIGASVMIKGTTRGATTDINGKVCIDVRKGETIVISYIGYPNYEIYYTGQNIGTVTMKPDMEYPE